MLAKSAGATRHGLVIGLAGYSGSGKTTLAEKLIAAMTGKGINVATIKHAHHDFDPDIPGKDSWRHRKAGARQVLVSSDLRRVLFTETDDKGASSLDDLLSALTPAEIVLVEGFKNSNFPKIEIWREATGKPLLYPAHAGIIAIASDKTIPDCSLPWFDLEDIEGVMSFIMGLPGRC